MLVPFVARESYGHLGDNTRNHCPETLVQAQRCLSLHNLRAGLEETALRSLGVFALNHVPGWEIGIATGVVGEEVDVHLARELVLTVAFGL